MTGIIVEIATASRTGLIRTEEGSQLTFCAAGVLGEFDSLAVGHRVTFDLDRIPPEKVAIGVFREPAGPAAKLDGLPDFRYAGFRQTANVRTYRFDAANFGSPVREFMVTVDVALLLKHHVGFQEAPALCLRKLSDDLKSLPDAGGHELNDDYLLAFAASKASLERKKPKFGGRRGAPPSGPVA